VWAVILGFFLLGEVPQPLIQLGAAIVVASGLFIVWRERMQHRASAAELSFALSE
jgi:drug/metabolite transporter (DMT)-like permease